MTAGFNVQASIWCIYNRTDDAVGGAVLTGTLTYVNVDGRLSMAKPDYLLLQQGYEIKQLFTYICRPEEMVIREKDELEITKPVSHPYYGDRFKIISVQRTSFHPSDSRTYYMLSLERVEYAHNGTYSQR